MRDLLEQQELDGTDEMFAEVENDNEFESQEGKCVEADCSGLGCSGFGLWGRF